MRKRKARDGYRGFASVNAVVAVGLMLLMAALVMDAVVSHERMRESYFWRQAALWAASGQLQRLQAGAPLDSRPPAGVIASDIELTTTTRPAEDEWRGFTHVTVFATARLGGGGQVVEQVSGYVPTEVRP